MITKPPGEMDKNVEAAAEGGGGGGEILVAISPGECGQFQATYRRRVVAGYRHHSPPGRGRGASSLGEGRGGVLRGNLLLQIPPFFPSLFLDKLLLNSRQANCSRHKRGGDARGGGR